METFDFEDMQISLTGFNKEPENRNYEPAEGDIAVSAQMTISKDGLELPAEPIYIIRGASPMGVKSYVPEFGVHIRFTSIDPSTQKFKFQIAKDKRKTNYSIPLEITENVQRSDYIILQAQIFPAINLLWFGCMFMMVGLFMAWVLRMQENNRRGER